MKSRQGFRFGITTVGCAHLLAACGGGGPASEPAASAASSAPAAAPVAQNVAAADWPAYNRTLAGDRFSPLAEIDRGNVAQLRVACTYVLPEVVAMQAGPIVVDGTMYFTTERGSYSIDAATCAEKWRVERQSSRPSPLGVQRGFAYLDGRLFRGTSDAHVLALDAADGHTLWDVTTEGAGTPGLSMPMAPISANGLVFIGNAGGDQTGVTGHVYALDARDGRVVWRFDVVPDDPAVRATWPNSDRYPITGGAFWTSFALDAERGVLYVPAGNPAPDFDVEARGGDNLYANSLIALDAATGRLLGYNQLVKRDSHDWDVNAPPVLGTTRGGRTIVASANKDGLLSVLDRGALATNAELGARLPTLFQSPTTTRKNVDVPLSRTERVRFCPGIQGGNEWNGPAFHPALNTLYTGAVDFCASVQLAQEVTVPSAGAIWFGSAVGEIQEPPDTARGWITAFDADTGAVRWKFAAPAPVVAGVTPTAGGLVFAADLTGRFRAFDAESGAVLYELDTGQSIGGGIVSYSAAGRQRIGVASGMKSGIWPGAATETRIQVFALP
ncbi:MAG TPA: PQQ-binding-like beta-propeller repeat protein [Gemmatimonadaceae bacterium]|nr:PQQ-binding-like beta-propeller repeat protein [Gemmatimonadaceae bacterium]